MTRSTLSLRGQNKTWAVTADLSQEQIDAMRSDGIEVGELINSVPVWAVDLGLTRIWCFAQDVWSFRNPFGWSGQE